MFIRKVSQFIEEKHLLGFGDKVLVALSGGADSVALLRVLLRLGYVCEAAHCNFHLRGEESVSDECFVRALAESLGVPLHVIHFDTTGIEFVMTALFVVMFIDQWEDAQDHKPALVGIVCSVICLVIFGSGKFILPLMASIVLCFLGMKKHEEKRKKERIQKSGEYQA